MWTPALIPHRSGLIDPAPWALKSGAVKSTLDIDLVNNRAWNNLALTTIAALLACSRASSGYYQKADGTLQNFGSNTLRYGTNGLLVEEARTTYAKQSQAFDNATNWTITGATVTPNAGTAPDGTNTACLLTPATGNSSKELYATVSPPGGSVAHTFSFYAKSNGGQWIGSEFNSTTATDGAYFDVINGVVGHVGAGGTATITALANGWYRCTTTQTNNGAFCGFEPHSADSQNITWNSAAGAEQFLIWGAQYEVGSFATSYIPTTTTNVVRAADIVTFSDLTWFDGTAESLYAEWVAKNVASATVLALNATNAVTLNEQAGMSPEILDAGATFALAVANTAAAGATVKAAARMATNNIALCMNGGTVATDVTATQPGTLSAARLGIDLSGANALNGYIHRIAAFKSVLLTNAALQALST